MVEKQIKLSEKTHTALSILKYELKLKTHNEAIEYLLKERKK